MDVNSMIEKLFDYYNVYTVTELAQKIGVQQPVISGWRSRNSVNAVKKKCRELGIFDKIFGDINSQAISSNHGQIAQNVSGNQAFTLQSIEDEIDPATYNLFLEAYQKAVEADDLKSLRVILMDY